MHSRATPTSLDPPWNAVFEALGTPIFGLLDLLITKLPFSKSNKLVKTKASQAKPGNMGYMVFIYYIYEEPEAMVGACFNWFKICYETGAIFFLRTAKRLHGTALKLSIAQFPTLPRLIMELIMVLTLDIIRRQELSGSAGCIL